MRAFSFPRLLSRFLGGSLWVYVGSLLIWLVLRALSGGRSVFEFLLNYLGAWLFFPVLIFGPWVFLKRHKREAVLLVVPVGLFLWFYGPLLLPRHTQMAELGEPVTVLTFNIRYTNTDIEALLAMLDSCPAEILALQEVTSLREGPVSDSLAERYPYHTYYEPGGLAIYSRHAISTQETRLTHPWSFQSVVVQVRGKQVHLINAHLARAGVLPLLAALDAGPALDFADARAMQIAHIQDAIRETGLPAIVACDCNMADLTSGYAQITATLKDAYRERGWGLGHTFLIPRGFEIRSAINLPVQRIDYLFHSPEIRITEVQVISGESGSDHRPLWAQFDLNPEGDNMASGKPDPRVSGE